MKVYEAFDKDYCESRGMFMEEMTIEITVEEFKELIKAKTRLEIFEQYVQGSKYSIDRTDCAAILGFQIEQEEGKDNDRIHRD